jgi:hypothetical protein
MAARARGRWVVLLLLLAGVVGLSALPTWVTATATAPVTGDVAVTVSGSQAAPGVVAAALVLLAAAGAVGLVGQFGRWVVVLVVAGAGVLVTSSALAARSGARTTAERLAADRTGVARLVDDPVVSVWPLVVAVLGVLVVLAAVALARASARWAPPSSRHERAGAGSAVGSASAGSRSTGTADPGPTGAGAGGSTGSAATDGTGPTDPARPTPGTGPDPTAEPAPAAERPPAAAPAPTPDDERATWDALSRGDDPT